MNIDIALSPGVAVPKKTTARRSRVKHILFAVTMALLLLVVGFLFWIVG